LDENKLQSATLTLFVTPDGEGFIALPIAFNNVITSASCEAMT